jgi:hypothetical protein
MLLVVLDEPELHQRMLSLSPSLRKKDPISSALLLSPPRCLLRSRSHREWRTGALVIAYSSELPPQVRRTTAVAPPLPFELLRAVCPCVNG